MKSAENIRIDVEARQSGSPATGARTAFAAVRHSLTRSVFPTLVLLSSLLVPAHAAGASSLRTLTIDSHALGGRTPVAVLLPEGYTTGTKAISRALPAPWLWRNIQRVGAED